MEFKELEEVLDEVATTFKDKNCSEEELEKAKEKFMDLTENCEDVKNSVDYLQSLIEGGTEAKKIVMIMLLKAQDTINRNAIKRAVDELKKIDGGKLPESYIEERFKEYEGMLDTVLGYAFEDTAQLVSSLLQASDEYNKDLYEMVKGISEEVLGKTDDVSIGMGIAANRIKTEMDMTPTFMESSGMLDGLRK